jgi:hypothetical protein
LLFPAIFVGICILLLGGLLLLGYSFGWLLIAIILSRPLLFVFGSAALEREPEAEDYHQQY